MNVAFPLRLLLLISLPAVWAEDLTTLDGKVYRNYKVTARGEEGLSIIHEAGTCTIPFDYLPLEVRKKQPDPSVARKTTKDRDKVPAKDKDAAPVIPPHDPEKDLVTLDGQVYRNYAVKKVEPDGLSITHDSGASKVNFERLSLEIQKQYNYDPFVAYDHNQAVIRREQEAEKQLQERLKKMRDEVAAADAERVFLEAFARTSMRVRIQAGLDSYIVCHGSWGRDPMSMNAAELLSFTGGVACDVVHGKVGSVSVVSGAIKKPDRKAWLYEGVAEPSFVHMALEEFASLSGDGTLQFNQKDGSVTKLSHEMRLWRIGKLKIRSNTGLVVLRNYTTSSSMAEQFYRKHGLPKTSNDVVLEWSAIYK